MANGQPDKSVEALIRRCAGDFEYYAWIELKIRPKAGGKVIPFRANPVQKELHRRFQDQKARTGKVRALVLKARQQGVSTYVQGRFFWRVQHNEGIRAFILTHEQAATDHLFGMAQTFYDELPSWLLKPHCGAANSKELWFDRLGSGYQVATAGSKHVGRSNTAQLFHGSEVAFWADAETHMQGVGQTVANEPGTEIILESTGNGVGNTFHTAWQKAEAGESEYVPIFFPWFYSAEYAMTPPEGWVASVDDDAEYAKFHKLTPAQSYWRRLKISTDFQGSIERFQQEYPATSVEAFVNVGHNPYLPTDLVMRARKAEADAYGARILGVDPARYGGARSAFVLRQGRRVVWAEAESGLSTMQVVGRVSALIAEGKVDKVFIDVVGLGAGVVDRLHELGYEEMVVGVDAGSAPIEPKKYLNKRAEMYAGVREWLDQVVQIPDRDDLQADLVGPRHSYESSQKLRIEKKEDMVKRGQRSPDYADALALTFAFPVSGDFDRSRPREIGHAPRRILRSPRDWRVR